MKGKSYLQRLADSLAFLRLMIPCTKKIYKKMMQKVCFIHKKKADQVDYKIDSNEPIYKKEGILSLASHG